MAAEYATIGDIVIFRSIIVYVMQASVYTSMKIQKAVKVIG